MTDTSLHAVQTLINSISRNEKSAAAKGVYTVNMKLKENNIIHEPSSSQVDITQSVFEKLTRITQIQEKASVAQELNINYVKNQAVLQSLKSKLNEMVVSKANEDIVNDVLGG